MRLSSFMTVPSVAYVLMSPFFLSSALAEDLKVSFEPSSVAVCKPVHISWSGGQAPYNISILSTKLAENDAGPLYFTVFDWLAALPSGSNVTITVLDSKGANATAGPLIIQAGGDDSCIDGAFTTNFEHLSSVAATATPSGSNGASATQGSNGARASHPMGMLAAVISVAGALAV